MNCDQLTGSLNAGLPPAPVCTNGRWTEFFNRDNPNRDGDFETLASIDRQFGGRSCLNPTAVDVQLVSNGRDYRSVGQVVQLNLTLGFICLNREQPEGRNCLNYKVRFCCPSKFLKVLFLV